MLNVSNDILYSIFSHIAEVDTLETVKSKIYKLEDEKTKKQKDIQEKKEYFETTFKNKRDQQDYSYDLYLQDKSELIQSYKKQKTKDNIYKLLEKTFDYKEIDDVFTHDITRNKNLDSIGQPARSNDIIKKSKPMKENPAKNPDEKPFDWTVSENDLQTSVKFWKKQKDAMFHSFYDFLIPFDQEDADAINEDLLTSSTLNLFLYNFIKNNKLLKKYHILHAEFYYEYVKMLQEDGDLKNLLDGYLQNIDKDWNNKIMIIPINLDNIHWIVSIIDPRKKTIYVLDPYGSEQTEVAENIQTWRSWLISTFPNLSDDTYGVVYIIDDIVNQDSADVTNCGVYVIMYVIFYIKYGRFPKQSDVDEKDLSDIRKYLYYTLYQIVKCGPGKKINPKTKRCIQDK